jgi:hypothetical protein
MSGVREKYSGMQIICLILIYIFVDYFRLKTGSE